MNIQDIKATIREAFKDVRKNGIGVREAIAIDDYASVEEREAARREDVEVHWWDIPPQWQPRLTEAFSFTDIPGFRFLLPAAMTASLDRVDDGLGHSVWFQLAHWNQRTGEQPPHHGHPPFIKYLEGISARDNANYFSLDAAQIHAVACFLDWYMRDTKSLIYLPRERYFEITTKTNQSIKEQVPPENYSLTIEDEMAVFDQECRIVREWLAMGGIQPTA
jgi:hypothetical protein